MSCMAWQQVVRPAVGAGAGGAMAGGAVTGDNTGRSAFGGMAGHEQYAGTGGGGGGGWGRPKSNAFGMGLPTNPSPQVDPQDYEQEASADAIMAPLTSALEKLSVAVDPSSSSHKLQGINWKP